MSTLTGEPASPPPPIDAHVPPPRGAGLRKNAVYLAGLVGAATVLAFTFKRVSCTMVT